MTVEPLTFSIVIPTFRRPQPLRNCLDAIAGLEYPQERFEVIVVDDGSEDPDKEVIAQLKTRLPNLQLILQKHAGPAAARNTGASNAKHDYLVFTDDDCLPLPDWLTAFAERFRNLPDHAIGGRTLNALPENPFSTVSQLLMDYLYSYFHSADRSGRFFASNNLAFPRKQFQEIGGFNTIFPKAAGEDREICYRWIRSGYSLTYAPEVVLYHQHPLTWRIFLKQHFNYGRGTYLYHRLRAEMNRESIRMEPLSFYMKLIQYPFVRQYSYSSTVLAFLTGITQLANAAGFYWERIGRPKRLNRQDTK